MKLSTRWIIVLLFLVMPITLGIAASLAFVALGILGVSLVISAIIPQIITAVALYFLLGEHRRNRLSELLDYMEATQKLSHLIVYMYPPPSERFPKPVDVWIENSKTQKVYRPSKLIRDAMNSGVLQLRAVENEDKLKEIMDNKGFTIIEREATLSELLSST